MGERITWISRPARARPIQAFAAGGLLVLAATLAGLAIGSAPFGVVAGVLLFVSLRHYFFSTSYILDEHGVAVRCLGFETRRPWTRVRRFRFDEKGGFLSPRVSPGMLDSVTGLHLTWGDDRERVIGFIEEMMVRERPGVHGCSSD